MCNRVFNMTQLKDQQMKTLFWKVSPKCQPQACKQPCIETVFDTQFMAHLPSQDPVIQLKFEPIVSLSVTTSSFSISPNTLVGRLGGSVCSGRTLLWGLLTVIAGNYLILCNVYTFHHQYQTWSSSWVLPARIARRWDVWLQILQFELFIWYFFNAQQHNLVYVLWFSCMNFTRMLK